MSDALQSRRASRGVVFALGFKSLWHRRLTALLTVCSVAVGVALLTGVERIRTGAKASFANTISGADLIVGARGGPLHLVLYSLFRVGDATNNIRWASYQAIAERPEVAWTIPLSLGDAHRGFRVLGTNADYFAHYRFGRDRSLQFAQGRMFADAADAVLGADVAAALGYRVGDAIVVSHGIGETSFEHHDDNPFRVVGVLARTGTPVDRTVHVTLEGVRDMHAEPGDGHDHDRAEDHDADADDQHHDDHGDHDAGHADADHDADHADGGHDADDQHHDDHAGADQHHEDHGDHDAADQDHDDHDADHADGGDDADDQHHDDHADADHADGGHADDHHAADLHHEDHEDRDADHADADHDVPAAITACIVGLKARPQLLLFQRFVNEYAEEPLLAVAPGVALRQLWELVAVVETALLLVSALVVVAGLVGMLAMLLANVAERRREMAVLRAVGAGRGLVFGLLAAEAAMLAAGGAALGVAAVHGALLAARGAVLERFGLALTAPWPGTFEAVVVGAVAAAAALVAAAPAWRLYRFSLADGLTVRV